MGLLKNNWAFHEIIQPTNSGTVSLVYDYIHSNHFEFVIGFVNQVSIYPYCALQVWSVLDDCDSDVKCKVCFGHGAWL